MGDSDLNKRREPDQSSSASSGCVKTVEKGIASVDKTRRKKG